MRLAQATAALALSMALCAAGAGAAPDSDRDRALELFKESKALYQQGRFRDAIERLEQAYALEPEPVLLYNLGRAYEGTGEVERAIEAYERYLREEPSAADRGAIEARLETLRRQLEEREALAKKGDEKPPTPPAKPPPPTADQAPERGPGVVPWIIAGTGVALVGAGAVLGLLARSREDESNDRDLSALEASDKHDEATRFATLANIGFIAGGVLAVGGVSFIVVSGSGSGSEARLAVGGRF